MLLLKDDYDIIHNFVLLDAHTHIRVNKQEGLVPFEFIRRFSKIVQDVAKDIKKNKGNYRFQFPWDLENDSPDYYDYCQKDVYGIFHPANELCRRQKKFMGFDFIITFSANQNDPLPRDYRPSNSKVREALIEKSPEDNTPHNNFRFIGFGRLDPNHTDALDAFDNVFQLGLRGLKVHPKEENFEINSEKIKEILKRAAHYNMPVLFHTQEGSMARIEELVNDTIKDLIDSNNMDLLPRLKVILGHAPWNGVGNKELYRILSHPNIFGELSTLKKESYSEFFSNSKSKINYEEIFQVKHLSEMDPEEIEGMYFRSFGYNHLNYWSSKLMFGSDTPYPPSTGSGPLLKHLFSKKFVGNTSDIQNIMGVSALRLIPTIAKRATQETKGQATTSSRYHPEQLAVQQKEARSLGMDPVSETFPRVRITGAVFSFFRDGDTQSLLFKSLFDSKKPMNMVIPNLYDLTDSSATTGRISIKKEIELNLGEG